MLEKLSHKDYRTADPIYSNNSTTSPRCLRFDDLRLFLLRLGFVERVRGSHHIFRKEGVRERVNLQSDGSDGSHAKPYQVRQVRQVVLRHQLEEED